MHISVLSPSEICKYSRRSSREVEYAQLQLQHRNVNFELRTIQSHQKYGHEFKKLSFPRICRKTQTYNIRGVHIHNDTRNTRITRGKHIFRDNNSHHLHEPWISGLNQNCGTHSQPYRGEVASHGPHSYLKMKYLRYYILAVMLWV